MRLKVIGSSSSGNCYTIESDDQSEILILEAGINPAKVGEKIGFRWDKVLGVLVSHEHGDHAKHIRDFQAKGLSVYASQGTADALGNSDIKTLNASLFWRLGKFRFRWFETQHDAAEPFGFVIQHPEMGNLLFVTDTARITQTFQGLNHIMVEANYDDESAAFNGLPEAHIERVRLSHLSIAQTLAFLERTDKSEVRNILLLHLSNRHGKKSDFLSRARGLGIPARIEAATPGLEINLNNDKMEF